MGSYSLESFSQPPPLLSHLISTFHLHSPSTSISLFLSPPSCHLPSLHLFPPTPYPPHPLALTLSPSSLSPSLSPSRLSGISLSLLPKYPQFHPPTTTLSFSLHIFSPSSPFNLPSILPSHPQYPPFSHFSTTNLTPPPSPNTTSLTLSTILPIHGSTYPRDNLSPIHSFTNTPSPLWAISPGSQPCPPCVCGHLLFTSGFLSLNSVVFFLLKKKEEVNGSQCDDILLAIFKC